MADRKEQSWLEVTVKVSHELEGAVRAGLSTLAPSRMWESEKKESGICLVKAAVVMDTWIDRIISEIEKALQSVEAKYLLSEPLPVELRVFETDEPAGGWPKPLHSRQVSSRLAVSPPCHHVRASKGQTLLFIDPQEAFGDGSHPTTRLALGLLDELLAGQYGPAPAVQGWVLDAGCGSGVLALAAAALGCFKVLAVDLDPRAIDAARGNLRLNPAPGSKVFLALGELSCAKGPFCLGLANLVPTLHVRAYETLWAGLAPGGWLILSGFCQTQRDSILRPYLRNGATEKGSCFDQAWAGVLLHKPESRTPWHG